MREPNAPLATPSAEPDSAVQRPGFSAWCYFEPPRPASLIARSAGKLPGGRPGRSGRPGAGDLGDQDRVHRAALSLCWRGASASTASSRDLLLRLDLAGRIGQSGVTKLRARRSICIACNPAFLGVGLKTMRRVSGVTCALGALALTSCGGTSQPSAAQGPRPDVAPLRAALLAAVKPSGTCPELVYCPAVVVRRAGAPSRARATAPARSTRCPELVYCPAVVVRRAGAARRMTP